MAKKNKMSREEYLNSINKAAKTSTDESSTKSSEVSETLEDFTSSSDKLSVELENSEEPEKSEMEGFASSSFAEDLDKYNWDSETQREVTDHDYMGEDTAPSNNLSEEELSSSSDVITESDIKRAEKKELQNAMKLNIFKDKMDGEFTIGTMTDSDYGDLLPFINDNNVTDINWNGKALWIDDIQKGRYKADLVLTDDFVNVFSIRVSNVVSRQFNKYTPELEAEAENLRVTVMHESVSHTGRSISIRKTPAIRRINFKDAVQNGNYVTETVMNLLSNSVKAGMNIVVCGLPGAGKTELVKYLTNYIFPRDRVITIEDTLELHYAEINPGKDCIEFKVTNNFDYTAAIKACLRLLPKWILLSEARSTEVRYLLESVSTGTKCLTTLHTDDVSKIPSRVVNMIGEQTNQEEIANSVYEFFNMGILVDKTIGENGIERFISQICFFSRENGENKCTMVVDDRELINTELPKEITRMFKRAGIKNPFEYTYIKD
jgi:pilus assembly protein CpaF